MKSSWWTRLVMLSAIATASQAFAGPNEGGVLLVHTDNSITYTSDGVYLDTCPITCPQDYECPPYEANDVCTMTLFCANPTSDRDVGGVDGAAVWWIVAAFPDNSCPRVSSLAFGIDWEELNPGDEAEDIILVDSGQSGDLELGTEGWPSRGAGVGINWISPQVSRAFEIYWFAGYAYATPELFQIIPHPGQGLNFADDSVPSNIDEVVGVGALGLGGADGHNPIKYYYPCPSPIEESSWGSIKARYRH